MSEAFLVSDLSLIYGESNGLCVLEDVSFTIHEREFVAILGPSGCGKSSLLNILAGFIEPTSGTLTTFGKPIIGPSSERGIVFQHHSLFPWRTALGNVLYPLQLKQLNRQEAKRQAKKWLREIGLEGFEDFYPCQLSGGMQHRVSLARLFAADPASFLMDEPFGALDSHTRLQMQQLLLEIWERHRHTVLFVTHDSEEALLLADRVLIMSMRPGTIIAELEVPLPRPRDPGMLFTPQLVSLRKHAFSVLRSKR